MGPFIPGSLGAEVWLGPVARNLSWVRRKVTDILLSVCHLLVVVLVDVSDKWTRSRLNPQVLQCLTKFSQVPSILVLNKVRTAHVREFSFQSPMALTMHFVHPACPGRLPEAEVSSPGADSSPH
jgi:hypothetical protein